MFIHQALIKFLKKNFFIFLKNNEKKELIEKLYEYQPLSEINNNPRFQGFNNLLALALKQNDSNLLSEFF